MFKVIPELGGWNVYWLEDGAEPRLIPHTNEVGEVIPHSKRQAAYRKKKRLENALKELNEQKETRISRPRKRLEWRSDGQMSSLGRSK